MKKIQLKIVAFVALVTVLLLASCASTTKVYKPVSERAQITRDMMDILDADPVLKDMMKKSIAQAASINPDKNTNPAQDLDSFYDFLDWASTCLPWNVLKEGNYPTLYSSIDQSVDYIWFFLDQPLPELAGAGYYYPTLQYHEPIASWLRKYAATWGEFLSTPESWNDAYYQKICDDKLLNMDKGWYASTNIWTSFNDFFARHLIDPSVRPIGNATVTAPADSAPQGIWNIDDRGYLHETVKIKSAQYEYIPNLIGPDSKFKNEFMGGTLTHTFLDVNDYHRYHFPVSGTIREVSKIKAVNGAGGVTIWDPEVKRYVLLDSAPGWQSLETRDCVIIETEEFGLVAVLPIGMSQISSCNWEDSVVVGAKVQKGDPMGYFLFGGSDIVMVFQKGVKVDLNAPKADNGKYKHILMGENYATLSK